MPDPNKVAQWRAAYVQKTDAELLFEKHHWVPHDERHIAADMELQVRRDAAAERLAVESRAQHQEGIEQGRTLHGETQRVAWYAFWVGLGAFLVAGAAFFHDLAPQFFYRPSSPTESSPPSAPTPVSSATPSPTPEATATDAQP